MHTQTMQEQMPLDRAGEPPRHHPDKDRPVPAPRKLPRPPEPPAEHAARSTPPLLAAMGGDPNDGPLLVMLHHLEMAVRFAEARAAGVTVVHDLFAQQLVRLLAAG